MTMLKQLAAVTLALAMILALTACGDKTTDEQNNAPSASNVVSEVVTEPAPAPHAMVGYWMQVYLSYKTRDYCLTIWKIDADGIIYRAEQDLSDVEERDWHIQIPEDESFWTAALAQQVLDHYGEPYARWTEVDEKTIEYTCKGDVDTLSLDEEGKLCGAVHYTVEYDDGFEEGCTYEHCEERLIKVE